MNTLLLIMIAAVALKAMIGFHFPWEKCECCGRKWRDHRKFRGIITSMEAEEEDYTVYILLDKFLKSTGLPLENCVGFDPKVGDVVEINETDWTIRKI